MVRELGKRILEHAGYKVITAEDGWGAVDEFKKDPNKFDLLLIDVVMPNLGGHDAYDKMLEIRPDLPVLFASGYSENAVHTNFVLHKGLKLIQKPFTRESLLRAIRAVLDKENDES
jgi:CheY-like chemotaxis protein